MWSFDLDEISVSNTDHFDSVMDIEHTRENRFKGLSEIQLEETAENMDVCEETNSEVLCNTNESINVQQQICQSNIVQIKCRQDHILHLQPSIQKKKDM